MIPWYIPVALAIITVYIWYPWYRKKYLVADDGNLEGRFFLQYLFAASIGFLLAKFAGEIVWDRNLLLITLLGVANGFAVLCQWRATAISLSKLSILDILDDGLAITLGFIILKENRLLNSGTVLGLALAFTTALLLAWNDWRRDSKNVGINQQSRSGDRKIYFYIMIFSIVWGFYGFSKRHFALEGVSITNFLFGWYGGSFITATAIFLFVKVFSRRTGTVWTVFKNTADKRTVLFSLGSSAFIMAGIFFSYWSSQLAPLFVTEPYVLLAEMIFPTLTGLWIFNERKDMTKREWSLFVLGALAAVLIALNYHW